MAPLESVAAVSIVVGVASALIVTIDVARLPQRMWIMNVVWPVTALWAGPFAVWAYFLYGRAGSWRAVARAEDRSEPPPNQRQPFGVLVAKGTTHCGAGCMLGDIVAETFALAVPLSLFGYLLFGSWVYDYVAAFLLGIVFQYFTIKPMRQLDRKHGMLAAVKADALSLTSWQIGMYGWMAVATFVLFHRELAKGSLVFWFMMQIAMAFGFLTAYPVNVVLLKVGLKDRM